MIFLLTRWYVWAAVVGLFLVLGLQFGGKAKTWWAGRPVQEQKIVDQVQEIDRVQAEVLAKQATIATLTQRIEQLKKTADAERLRAAAFAADAARWQTEARQLQVRVAGLEAARRALVPVRSLQEATFELGKLGYARRP